MKNSGNGLARSVGHLAPKRIVALIRRFVGSGVRLWSADSGGVLSFAGKCGLKSARPQRYNVFHVGATYEPTFVEWLEGLKFSVVVDNLFDEEYCDYATYGTQYYPAAGRRFTFSVRYEF